ncbi:MAG: 50S ribosomal protein L29 [Saprospiraceae bacterium]|nr:50S ribosomal protein L29 [Saprospiraceae bacterium]|tara:strand:+ start:1175 stop:1435 length:261 start_codon:yes stop_codon:yes gene_type:complete
MASKKYIELQEFTDPELMDELNQTEVQYQKMTFDHAIKGLDNPILLKEVRRDIARLKTEVRRRELAKLSPEEMTSRSKIRSRRKRH